mmetsp:Transcript_100/g.164  ORF Transcript_100/g.164 Transcript_100/m.164 type:complete len:222 (-) Transcript_100:244-909(-)
MGSTRDGHQCSGSSFRRRGRGHPRGQQRRQMLQKTFHTRTLASAGAISTDGHGPRKWRVKALSRSSTLRSFALTTKLRPRQNVCRAPATGGVSAAASTARPTEVDSKRHPTSARRNSLASRRQAGSWKGRRCSKPPSTTDSHTALIHRLACNIAARSGALKIKVCESSDRKRILWCARQARQMCFRLHLRTPSTIKPRSPRLGFVGGLEEIIASSGRNPTS